MYQECFNISIGVASYGCFTSDLNFGSPIIIGNYCSFAKNVHFIPGNHPIRDVSTHPFFHRAEFGYVEERKPAKSEPTIVGHDVWIGRDTIVLPKCKSIGNGAIIGAGTVVTRNVEPYTIVAGNPARILNERFSPEMIERIEESKWYDLSPAQLVEAFPYAKDVDKFLECVSRIKTETEMR